MRQLQSANYSVKVKVSLERAMKAERGVHVQSYSFLALTRDRCVGVHRLALTGLSQGHISGTTVCTGGWLGSRTCLDVIMVHKCEINVRVVLTIVHNP